MDTDLSKGFVFYIMQRRNTLDENGFNEIFDVFNCFQFHEELNSKGNESLVLFTGLLYARPSKESLIKIKNLIDNTLEDFDYLSELLTKENESILLSTSRCPAKVVEKKSQKGYVYVAKCEHLGFFKIGCAFNVNTRINQLRTANPTLYLFKQFYVSDIKFEKELHKKFESKKIRGEWFDLNDSDLDFIEGYLKGRNDE